MAKHRKTREEKIRSSRRQQARQESHAEVPTSSQTASSGTFSYKLPTASSANTPHSTKTTAHALSYDYVSHDLKHTLFITGSIILAQIILFVILQTR